MVYLFINVSDIIKDTGASKKFEGNFNLEDVKFSGEILKFPFPIYVEGSIINGGDLLLLNATVEGNVVLQCGGCREFYTHPFNFHFESNLCRTPVEDDPEIFTFEGEKISVKDIVVEYLLLELPIRRKCRIDCKGLCPYCGTNLNVLQCKCEGEKEQEQEDNIDSRMSALKDFFTQDKEV